MSKPRVSLNRRQSALLDLDPGPCAFEATVSDSATPRNPYPIFHFVVLLVVRDRHPILSMLYIHASYSKHLLFWISCFAIYHPPLF